MSCNSQKGNINIPAEEDKITGHITSSCFGKENNLLNALGAELFSLKPVLYNLFKENLCVQIKQLDPFILDSKK